uniref:DUF148 domain-containing protein n=1 Tax=Parastrongyloides trichosuri TaxID=131310 RepID=A0A0N4Z686_PARTI
MMKRFRLKYFIYFFIFVILISQYELTEARNYNSRNRHRRSERIDYQGRNGYGNDYQGRNGYGNNQRNGYGNGQRSMQENENNNQKISSISPMALLDKMYDLKNTNAKMFQELWNGQQKGFNLIQNKIDKMSKEMKDFEKKLSGMKKNESLPDNEKKLSNKENDIAPLGEKKQSENKSTTLKSA